MWLVQLQTLEHYQTKVYALVLVALIFVLLPQKLNAKSWYLSVISKLTHWNSKICFTQEAPHTQANNNNLIINLPWCYRPRLFAYC